jgi:hypothetical protein
MYAIPTLSDEPEEVRHFRVPTDCGDSVGSEGAKPRPLVLDRTDLHRGCFRDPLDAEGNVDLIVPGIGWFLRDLARG